MITFGNAIIYASMLISALALVGLLLKELKNNDILTRFVTPAIVATSGLLAFAYVLITYYFVTSDFTYEYVWQYSSRDLPLIYKISGVWAGQQGTYLLWVLIIFFSAAWLSLTTKHAIALARRTQIITLVIGTFFIILTIIQSPFKSIYELPNVPPGFIPPDGSGLNALLVNFWMIVHPTLLFIGYGAVTIPFAAAIVYLLTKDDGWEELSRQWARFTWLVLGMGIAVGGVWAYLVLGWGGFWAWDPVETASLIPWLTLTGFLHAAALHRKNKSTFSIAAPMLAVVSFVLVLYAALVVRSGLFNSVHAFGETSTGTLLIISIFLTSIVSIVLGMRRYLSSPETTEDWGLWSKRNVFYITLLLFVILAFISFWGITFPVFIQLTQNLKVGVASDTKNFFNIWSYPFTIILLLALGFCLNYKESEKEWQKKTLLIVVAITIIAMLLRTGNFYVLDHKSPFYVREPPIYKLIGSISLLSIFPPLIYAAASTYRRLEDYLGLSSTRPKIKGIGITIIHFGVVFILIGAVISSSFTQTMSINVPLAAKGELMDIGNDYGVKIIDFSTRSFSQGTAGPGTRISEIILNPENYTNNNVQVGGKVIKVVNTVTNNTYTTYFELDDGTGSLWAVTQAEQPFNIPEGTQLTISGFLNIGFTSPTTGTPCNPNPCDLLIFSRPDEINPADETSASGTNKVQHLELEVYQGNRLIGNGAAEYLQGKGTATFPMVKSSITGSDTYVIFQGASSGTAPLTLKIIPAVNLTWIGIVLFAVGIILIMAVRSRKSSNGGV